MIMHLREILTCAGGSVLEIFKAQMSLFGVIVAGRAVQTDFRQVDATKYLIDLPDAKNINHIVVFLTNPLPFGYAAT